VAQPQDLNAIYGQFEQHYQAGHYAEAERLGKQALDLCEARFGRDRPHCAWTLNNLANVYKKQSKYAQAEEFYKRALAIR
jgi:tetratricopeptide (TPR) repeat protein